jgi:hypothetical protein
LNFESVNSKYGSRYKGKSEKIQVDLEQNERKLRLLDGDGHLKCRQSKNQENYKKKKEKKRK